ncbi:MAG: hypothetical protein AAF412_15345, partial [Pseudomonadota bacterium]
MTTGAIASLPMYDWPETRLALERLWAAIAIELEASKLPAPKLLTSADEFMEVWTSPDLVIGQTCGWPYANLLQDVVVPFGRFDHALPGCKAGKYYSVYIGQSETDRQFLNDGAALGQCPRIAINGEDSQSGFHVFSEISREFTQDDPTAAGHLMTGSHRKSVLAVANGEARIAAIDAVAF